MPRYTAKTADKHVLYQIAVQSAEAEVAFVDRVYKRRYGRPPARLREDFCGTALICCAFVRKRKDNRAWGIDLHKPTQEWGRRHNIAELPDHAAKRIELVTDNVMNVTAPKVEAVGAFNFSYYIFKQRPELVAYFEKVRASLADEGLFFLDAYGGYEAQQVMEEETRYEGFTYVWDQAEFNPIDDHTTCHIHFKFPDGSMQRKAFTYDWRLWTLAGIRDALIDAGFASTEVYWEGTDADGEGNGSYRRQVRGENTPGWNAYVVGVP